MTAAIRMPPESAQEKQAREQRATAARSNLRQVVASLDRAINYTDDPVLYQALIQAERVIVSIAGAV